MARAVKTIGGKKYVYICVRNGSSVLHKYVGPYTGEPETPPFPARLFWDTDPRQLSRSRHAKYIVERILEFGDTEAIRWLARHYPVKKILELLRVSRTISEKSRLFWEIWFEDI